MVHIRQPFFSIMTAMIFSLLGLLHGLDAINGTGVVMISNNVEINTSAAWALTGVMFLMAYFALVHLKEDSRR